MSEATTPGYEDLVEENKQLLERVNNQGHGLFVADIVLKQTREELRRIKSAIADLRVLRSSCDDSNAGDFRVHLCEREFDELCAMVSSSNFKEEESDE